MELYLLRHGRSRADDEGRIESRYDAPLTDTGEEQARAVAADFASLGMAFDAVFSSPLSRAARTADIVTRALGIPAAIVAPEFSELDRGVLSGLLRSDADERHPAPAFRNRFERFPGNSGESPFELRARAMLALQKTLDARARAALLVSHGHFLHELLSAALGVPIRFNDRHGAAFSFGDCGWARLSYRESADAWVLRELVKGK